MKAKLKVESPVYQLDGLGSNPLYGFGEKLNAEQRAYAEAIIRNQIVFSNSPSGTGKTTVAVAIAKLMWEYRIVSNLIYLFAPIQEGEMGHRPGTQEEKNDAYLDPLYDALVAIKEFPMKATDPQTGWVDAKPHTFLRGTNLENSFVIIDEAQNLTKPQLKKILTRIHATPRTRAVVMGHTGQIDLKNPAQSGFESCIEHFRLDGRTAVANLTQKNYRGWISEHADKW